MSNMSKVKRPNCFDWLIYRLFRWRWNPILSSNRPMLDFIRHCLDDEETTGKSGNGGE